MAVDPKKVLKYSIHLGTPAMKDVSDILTDNAVAKAQELKLKSPLPYEAKLFFRPTFPSTPAWAKKLDQFFEVGDKIESASASAVLVFKCGSRVMACAYGHGHTMLDNDKCENDFGLLVAANSLSDENVKLVEKANLGSVIRDATQAAGITRLQEFNVDRALSLVRKLSGNAKTGGASLSGSSSITLTSDKDVGELHELGEVLLDLYGSKSYQKTAFGIIDKIKPVMDVVLLDKLDHALLTDIASDTPSFELGAPEIDTQPIGYMTISGSSKRTRFPDVSLATFLGEIPPLATVDDLHKYRLILHSIDGTHKLKDWSLHKGLVGSLAIGTNRYALNEGKWYRVDHALQDSANSAFADASKGIDVAFLPWPLVGGGKNGKTSVYETEGAYNKRVCDHSKDRFLYFDTQLVPVPNNPGPGIEICDILDLVDHRLIHVKKSGRRSSIISHFLMQGMNSAKSLRTYDAIRNAFFEKIKAQIPKDQFELLTADFPQGWTVEYKFGDMPNSAGQYTIPFFSRVTFDEVKREVEALGFKAVEISFIRLSQPPKK